MRTTRTSREMLEAAKELCQRVDSLRFSTPVEYIYNPLQYAWDPYRCYLERFARGPKRVFFLGMNPGPWGMAQTGIPFGEVSAVREWLRIDAPVGRPQREHPKRPILGMDCERSEVSGRRVWELFAARSESSDAFFREHFVANYCPLVFMDDGGRNVTPDQLPVQQARPLQEACDWHLGRTLELLRPDFLVGVGHYAEACLKRVSHEGSGRIVRILHPSPASPAANRGWGTAVEKVLAETGVWPKKS
ncbi:MAG: uracil-DNA glycosylase family protein [Planctomycetota bacterium]|jgi:single-strand selective monofunctional uracil DNA glycosylase